MRKAFLLGCLVQIIFVVLTLAIGQKHVLIYGNLFMLVLGIRAAFSTQSAGGWEYVGVREEEKKSVDDFKVKALFQVVLFMLPGVLVVAAYYLKFGELL